MFYGISLFSKALDQTQALRRFTGAVQALKYYQHATRHGQTVELPQE